MGLMSRLKNRLHHSGLKGTSVVALRYMANRIDRKQIESNSKAKHTDEFLAWVRSAVPGMLDQGNIDAMEYAIANMPAEKPILEIGSFCGLSTIVLSSLLDKYSRTTPMYSCDAWQFEGQKLGSPLGDSLSVTHDTYRAFVIGTFVRNLRAFAAHRLPYTIECLSDEFFRRWSNNEKTVDVFGRQVTLGGEIGFCYIDGDHEYEFAKRDFENTNKALVSGGFILFDDSSAGSRWGAYQLVREIESSQQYDLVSKNPNYLFRKK